MPRLAPAGIAWIFVASSAAAAEFRSVQENAAVLYDAPSKAAKPLFVVQRHYPLEVIVNLEAWVKVRDHAGALTWIEKKALSDKRMVIVTGALAEARARPEEGAPAAFSAAQNVALELIEAEQLQPQRLSLFKVGTGDRPQPSPPLL